jgi:hypothetical protein
MGTGLIEWILSFGLPQPLLLGGSVGGGSIIARLLGIRFRYSTGLLLLPFAAFFSKGLTRVLDASPTETFVTLVVAVLLIVGVFRITHIFWRLLFKEVGFAGMLQAGLATSCCLGALLLLSAPYELESLVDANRGTITAGLVGMVSIGAIIAFYRTIQTGLQLIAWALLLGLVVCASMDRSRAFVLDTFASAFPWNHPADLGDEFLPYRVAMLSSSGERFIQSDNHTQDVRQSLSDFLNGSLEGVPLEVNTWNEAPQPFSDLIATVSDRLKEHATDLVVVSGWQTELKKVKALPLAELPSENSPELRQVLLEYKLALAKIVSSLEASHAMPVLLHEPCKTYRCEHYSGMFRRAMEEVARKYNVAILDIKELKNFEMKVVEPRGTMQMAATAPGSGNKAS